jgi:hypothetical protein
MPNKKHHVRLTDQERQQLHQLIGSGRPPHHAGARLAQNRRERPGSDRRRNRLRLRSVRRDRRPRAKALYATDGFERALYRKKPDRDYERILDGEGEAHLIALACSEAPDGYAQWSLRLLAGRMVELGHVEKLSYGTVRRTFKKTNLSLTATTTGSSRRDVQAPTS